MKFFTIYNSFHIEQGKSVLLTGVLNYVAISNENRLKDVNLCNK